jgi:molybdenum-dependent DNA-binding transcriptional regulator ModE
MLTHEERALLTDIGDRLLELYAERDEARALDDQDCLRELQGKIDEALAERGEIVRTSDAEESRTRT